MSPKEQLSRWLNLIVSPPSADMVQTPIRVLAVEDSAERQDEWDRLLRQAGVKIEVVSTQRAAMRRIESGEIDILILDWNLYSGNGQLILDSWSDYNIGAPAAVFATNASDELRREALRSGAHNVVARPIDLEMFSRIMGRYIHQVRREKALQALTSKVGHMEQDLYRVKLALAGAGAGVLFLLPLALIGSPGAAELIKAVM